MVNFKAMDRILDRTERECNVSNSDKVNLFFLVQSIKEEDYFKSKIRFIQKDEDFLEVLNELLNKHVKKDVTINSKLCVFTLAVITKEGVAKRFECFETSKKAYLYGFALPWVSITVKKILGFKNPFKNVLGISLAIRENVVSDNSTYNIILQQFVLLKKAE